LFGKSWLSVGVAGSFSRVRRQTVPAGWDNDAQLFHYILPCRHAAQIPTHALQPFWKAHMTGVAIEGERSTGFHV